MLKRRLNCKLTRPEAATLPEAIHLGVESTGDYHRLLAERAHARGITVYVLNPHDVHHYARALGRRAKTDRVDAALLARYLAQEHAGLHPWQPADPGPKPSDPTAQTPRQSRGGQGVNGN